MKYLKLFNTHSEYEAFIQTNNFIKPNVSHCIQGDDVHYNPYDYSDRYLTFIAKESGTFTFTPVNPINYSTDGGETWTLGYSVDVNSGDKVMWKGKMNITSDGVGKFGSTCNFDVQGNVMSLLYGDNFEGQTDLTGKNRVFYKLFDGNTKLINAKKLSLPATILAEHCYNRMFRSCTNLITAPALPATTLTQNCYAGMFQGCTSLIMAPVLPATTLIDWCYAGMFESCTSLTTAPELPATTLASSCYQSMFTDCTNLVIAPTLPATTLIDNCYYCMFQGCSNLNYIKAMFTTTPGTTYTSDWVYGVASNGTFVKNSAASWTTTGTHGIPTGWTVQTASA